jgi:uncharacterized membrane protein YtjA (UPF0391 family)
MCDGVPTKRSPQRTIGVFRSGSATSRRPSRFTLSRSTPVLHYAIVFLIIALIAGVLGFGGIAGSAVGIAKILFLVFIVLFVVSLLMGRRSRL